MRRGRKHEMNNDRVTNHGKVRYLRRNTKRILSRGIHLNIICCTENGKLGETNEANHIGSCNVMKKG